MKNNETITVEIETITPEIAKEYLKKNYEKNRKLGEGRVDYLADQIKRGLWLINGATICFNASGDLTDGQHRLSAIIKARKPAESLVVRGLPERSFHSIDTGKSRTVADILKISGEIDTNVLSCAARFVMGWERNRSFGHKWKEKVAYSDIAGVVKRHPGLRDSVAKAHNYSLKLKRIGPSFITAFYYLASVVDSTEAEAFMDHIFEGTDLSKGHPVLALRKILLSNQAEAMSWRGIHPDRMMRLWLKTWNLWAKGERVENITLKDTEELKEFANPVKNWKSRYGITYDKVAVAA